jgi:hypothetical protein
MTFIRPLISRTLSEFFSARRFVAAVQSMPWFLRSWSAYGRLAGRRPPVSMLWPCLTDRSEQAGSARGDYFYQDWWAARKVYESRCEEHVDVASRVDGFVAHCAVFTRVIYVDIRPLTTAIPTIVPRTGTVLELPFADRSLSSLSCLHVVEHIGLGRYGDPLDPNGSVNALRELQRVVAPGGQFYLGLPIGRERTCFNAHRIHQPSTVFKTLSDLSLCSFAAVDGRGEFAEGAAPGDFENVEYACGLFHFTRPA